MYKAIVLACIVAAASAGVAPLLGRQQMGLYAPMYTQFGLRTERRGHEEGIKVGLRGAEAGEENALRGFGLLGLTEREGVKVGLRGAEAGEEVARRPMGLQQPHLLGLRQQLPLVDQRLPLAPLAHHRQQQLPLLGDKRRLPLVDQRLAFAGERRLPLVDQRLPLARHQQLPLLGAQLPLAGLPLAHAQPQLGLGFGAFGLL